MPETCFRSVHHLGPNRNPSRKARPSQNKTPSSVREKAKPADSKSKASNLPEFRGSVAENNRQTE